MPTNAFGRACENVIRKQLEPKSNENGQWPTAVLQVDELDAVFVVAQRHPLRAPRHDEE
eukprot:SAG31_NODE_492_length_14913_cov_4.109086_4_plen_59_part_00